MIKWDKYFDKIYCIHLIEDKKRYEVVKNELERVDILNSGIFEWHYVVRNPLYKFIYSNENFKKNSELKSETHFNCTFEHFNIMMKSIEFGYERILIIEDDIRFLKDKVKMLETLENLPKDFDICMFDWANHLEIEKNKNLIKINDYYSDFSNLRVWSTACIGLSKEAMRNLIQWQMKEFTPADYCINRIDNNNNILHENDNLNRILATTNIGIQISSLDWLPIYERNNINIYNYNY